MTTPGVFFDGNVSTIEHFQANQYCAVASLAIVAWEALICAPAEYQVVWSRGFSVVNITYGVARYVGLALMIISTYFITATLSHEDCSRLILLTPIFALVNTIASQLLIAARTVALWEKSRTILTLIGTLMLFETALLLVGTAKWKMFTVGPSDIPTTCLGVIDPDHPKSWLNILFWGIQTVVEGVLFILSLWKVWTLRKRHGRSAPLLNVIARDGVFYFCAIFLLGLVSFFFLFFAGASLGELLGPFVLGGSSVLSCRSVLNLRSTLPITSVTPGSHIPPTSSKVGKSFKKFFRGSSESKDDQLHSSGYELEGKRARGPIQVTIDRTVVLSDPDERDNKPTPEKPGLRPESERTVEFCDSV